MTIIIGQMTPNEQIKYNIPSFISVKNICKLDKNEIYTIYIINVEINDFGLIKGTDIILDELLITYKIEKVYYKLENKEYLFNACSYYGVKAIELY